MQLFIHARVHPGQDDDLIEWLNTQSEGKRSEAIRALMRDGLRARQLEANLAEMIRQAVAEALAGIQVATTLHAEPASDNEVEEAFGGQLDSLLDNFG